jgi:signal transduction histidine kinase
VVQPAARRENGPDLARRLGALAGLPLRPATARDGLGRPPADADDDPATAPAPSRTLAELDPGWALFDLNLGAPAFAPLERVAMRPWWPAGGERARRALDRLWRHGVAAARGARKLAQEAGRDDGDRLAALALLHQLGLWALAAADAEALADLLEIPTPEDRREAERRLLGRPVAALGRALAERWGTHPDLAETAWLVEERPEVAAPVATDAPAIAILQAAFGWAERTPWALYHRPEDLGPTDPRLRVLIAEVQVRCGGGLVPDDAGPREEALARAHARLLLDHDALRRRCASQSRFLESFAATEPTASFESVAQAAGRAWCGEPGVTSAAVALGADPLRAPDPTLACLPLLAEPGRPGAHLVYRRDAEGPRPDPATHPALPAWRAWFRLLDRRDRAREALDAAMTAHRRTVAGDAETRARERLAALAEFAAGAAHELNNPLAVVVGRAQLLLARDPDDETRRYLRAILGQAQRAHRILRDLMAVARPSEPRWRPCQPGEILRGLLRDHRAELDARALRLEANLQLGDGTVWTDPDGLRQVVEILLRNAIEATPAGGPIALAAEARERRLQVTVRNAGAGPDERSLRHLLDPFYCGRQAGRGLGLGLPRAARYLEAAGGSLRWHAAPGSPTSMRVHLPFSETPPPVEAVAGPEAQAARPG